MVWHMYLNLGPEPVKLGFVRLVYSLIDLFSLINDVVYHYDIVDVNSHDKNKRGLNVL